MINFLHPKLKPKASSSCVTEDEYAVSNLVSEKLLSSGFMAFKVVKPPIDIYFELLVPVDIEKIVLWPSLGSLKTTGLEIYASSGQEYVKICQFYNITDNIITVDRIRDTDSTHKNKANFFSSLLVHRILNMTNLLKIVIKSTRNCAPVLSKVQVWGLPSKDSPANQQSECFRLWKECLSIENGKPGNSSLAVDNCQLSEKRLEIPEEFLDSVTCDIMMLPMTLPCGKTVDQSTIDRHAREEEKWGRLPSDPFTGKDFNANHKPILDASLKARIDRYLITTPNLQNIPRTLGRDINKQKHKSQSESYEHAKHIRTLDVNLLPGSSLDAAIQSALTKITRFSKPKEQTPIKINSCIICKSMEDLYKITTCSHLVCRKCLNVQVNKKKCSCSAEYKSSDIERFHE